MSQEETDLSKGDYMQPKKIKIGNDFYLGKSIRICRYNDHIRCSDSNCDKCSIYQAILEGKYGD